MKKLKPLVVSSYVLLALASMPFAALAQSDDRHGGEQEHAAHGSSFFEQLKADLSGWHLGLGGKVALAASSPLGTGSASADAAATPVINGVTSPTVLTVDQAGTWQVNAYDPENRSLSYAVDWGDGPKMMAMLANGGPVFTQTASFNHAYAAEGEYTVKFIVKNDLGLETASSVTVHVVAASSKPAPVISNLSATSTKPNRATVSWNTDLRADSELWYGTSTPVDVSGEADIIRKAQVFKHSLVIRNLSASTTYYVMVGSKGKDGVMTMSSEASFTTPAPATENQAPMISSVSGPDTLVAGISGTWQVNASDPENKSLSYAVDWGDGPKMMAMLSSAPIFTQTATFDHVYAGAGSYTVKFTVKDDAGLTATSSRTVTVTPAAPTVITGLTASSTVSNEADLSWKTDQPADSSVWLGTSTPVDTTGEAAAVDSALTTDHAITVSGLTASTTYYAVVGSTDGNKNTSTSSVSFTTAGE